LRNRRRPTASGATVNGASAGGASDVYLHVPVRVLASERIFGKGRVVVGW
jgi:hypothetical protein